MILIETQASQLARALSDTVGVAAVGYLDGATVDTYQTQISLSPSTTLAELDAAINDYAGYAQGTIVWQVPVVADDGTVEAIGTCAVFRPTDATDPEVSWGCYIVNAAATAVLFMGQFEGAPLSMASAVNSISLTFRFRPASNSLVVVVS